ncbi:uncharacterized protein LOC120277670 [Dioscorea cayenensis subsp. rotundata]|uniref:Uncharacterized protein LOC120277670 n=1 Tax=Dioscorea cayennensis subsp. rotundata TaxID=55577 RepID=A0AB40CK59_DIOCR|nr:uncharacterized protein LOC120277670 [Dioscorea cayenensis subsp. rotundata]
MEGIECATEKSSSKAFGSKRTFVFPAVAVNSRFNTEFSGENVENHYRTLKSRYAKIKKVRDLSGAGWDDATKIITLDPMVALTYIEAHPVAKPFINKPIEHYEALRVICGEDNATGIYATSVFVDLGDNLEHEGNIINNFDEEPVVSDDDADANSTPTYCEQLCHLIYPKVMEVDGFQKKELVQLFDFQQFCEIEARGFIVKDMDLRKDWIENFLSRMD